MYRLLAVGLLLGLPAAGWTQRPVETTGHTFLGLWHGTILDLSRLDPEWPRRPGWMTLWLQGDGTAWLSVGLDRDSQGKQVISPHAGQHTVRQGVRLVIVTDALRRERSFGMQAFPPNQLVLYPPQGPPVQFQRASFRFEDLDYNRDGLLSTDEVQGSRLAKLFVTYDKSGDKHLDAVEFETFWRENPPTIDRPGSRGAGGGSGGGGKDY